MGAPLTETTTIRVVAPSLPGESPKAQDHESSLSTAHSFETQPGNYPHKNNKEPAFLTGYPEVGACCSLHKDLVCIHHVSQQAVEKEKFNSTSRLGSPCSLTAPLNALFQSSSQMWVLSFNSSFFGSISFDGLLLP